MSLSSTSTIKGQLVASLGSKSNEYFETLQQFVAGKISRTEFEDGVHHILNAPNLSTFGSSDSLPYADIHSSTSQCHDHLSIRRYDVL